MSEWRELSAEVDRLTALARTVDLYGTAFVYEPPGYERVVLDPRHVTVHFGAERQTDIERLTERAEKAEAEVARLTAEVAEYRGDDQHVIEFRPDGWTIMHPIACRPDLFGCRYNKVGEQLDGPPPAGVGRYRCDLDEHGRLHLGERREAPDA